MKSKIGLLIALFAGMVLTVALTQAQNQPHQPPPQPNDPLAQSLFPPELVMQHQREIGLTGEQKAYLRAEIQRVTSRFNELQWQLQDAMEGLQGIMKESSVNEQQAVAQLERILDTEREIKKLHLELAIHIKNKLTVEQQAKLQELRKMMGFPHGSGGPRPGYSP